MSEHPRAPGLIVAAPRSGAGKTTVALGLMRAFRRRGLTVQPLKNGPDYIDPAFHAAAAGRPSFNIDTWAMRPSLIDTLIDAATPPGGLVIAEGAMGLFDGVAARGQTAHGATADLAARTGWPVLLVLDVAGQAETAAAIALGCAAYRKDIAIAGVILNRIASPRQLKLIEPGMARIGMPVLGVLPRDDTLTLPERHLGLVQAGETADLDAHLDRIADAMQQALDLDAIAAAARPGEVSLRAEASSPAASRLPPPGQRIALAADRAFSFTYPHLVAGWRAAGAEIIPFSPLADEAPDAAADAVWLPGGYPELHAGTLAAAARFKSALAAAAGRGVPIHGECGGYMMLGTGLEDAAGTRHAMAGLLALETSFKKRKLHLGYRRATAAAASSLGPAGTIVFGHEFHYASVIAATDAPLVTATDAAGELTAETGARRGSVSGTFFHAIDIGEGSAP